MLQNHEEIIVYMLLFPVVFNILLPLAMLVVWLFKQLLLGKMQKVKKTKSDVAGEQSRIPIAT